MKLALLASIISATGSDMGYGFFERNADLNELIEGGYAVINESLTDDKGHIATMATDKGKQAHADAANTGGEKPTESKEKPVYSVMTMARPAPAKRERASTGSKYPFDDIAAPGADGQVNGFFVPVSDDMPEPWKSLSSAVSQYNRKHGNVVGQNARGHDVYAYTKRFKITKIDEGDNKGAFVWRDADGTGEAETDDEQAEAENAAQG